MDKNKSYEVVVDTTLRDGEMKYGLRNQKGTGNDSYLFSTYSCHPSMANDNVSGMLMWAHLNKWVSERKTRNSYEFLIAPETIGMLAYLQEQKPDLDGAFVLTCVGGHAPFSKKRTFSDNHYIDKITDRVFNDMGISPTQHPFKPEGSDERQLSSPLFRVHTTSIHRGKYHEYDFPEYHTSYDKKLSEQSFDETLNYYKKLIEYLEADRTFMVVHPGEPMLGKRGLYDHKDIELIKQILFWSDRRHPLSEIATANDFMEVVRVANMLEKEDLIYEC